MEFTILWFYRFTARLGKRRALDLRLAHRRHSRMEQIRKTHMPKQPPNYVHLRKVSQRFNAARLRFMIICIAMPMQPGQWNGNNQMQWQQQPQQGATGAWDARQGHQAGLGSGPGPGFNLGCGATSQAGVHKWAKWVWAWRQYHVSHTKMAGKWCKWMFIPPLSGRYWPILKQLCPEMGNTPNRLQAQQQQRPQQCLGHQPLGFPYLGAATELYLYCIFLSGVSKTVLQLWTSPKFAPSFVDPFISFHSQKIISRDFTNFPAAFAHFEAGTWQQRAQQKQSPPPKLEWRWPW